MHLKIFFTLVISVVCSGPTRVFDGATLSLPKLLEKVKYDVKAVTSTGRPQQPKQRSMNQVLPRLNEPNFVQGAFSTLN